MTIPRKTALASHQCRGSLTHQVRREAAVSKVVLLFIAAVALLLAIATLQFVGSSAWQSKVSLTATGRTNGPDGERLVVFRLSNKSRVAIAHAPFYTIQGPDEIPVDEPVIVRNTKYTLRPGRSWVVALPAPKGAVRWRLNVECVRSERAVLSTWANKVPLISTLLPIKWRFPAYEPVWSEWVQ